MNGFSVFDLAGLVVVGWVLVKVVGPLAAAVARRIEGRASLPPEDPAVPMLQDELMQLQERVDFLERALTARESPVELPREHTPV